MGSLFSSCFVWVKILIKAVAGINEIEEKLKNLTDQVGSLEEGLEARFERHRRNHLLLRRGLEDLGFEFVVAEPYRLPMLNAVRIPDGVDDLPVRKALLNHYGIEIGGGLGQFAGKVWRIGLMGHSCRRKNVFLLLAALETVLNAQGQYDEAVTLLTEALAGADVKATLDEILGASPGSGIFYFAGHGKSLLIQ